MSHVPGKRKQI